MGAESLDACVTDAPYEINFMSKKWDSSGVAFDVETWRAVYRVLKPGAHLIAFGGTRTYHRMACAIEDAGFEIRDCIAWMYATGFPKSMSVPLAIDKMLGVESVDVGTGMSGTTRNVMNAALHPESFGGEFAVRRAVSPEAQAWEGWGTALKPAYEPCVVARKPLRERSIAAQVLATGTGAIDIDRCRISAGVETPTGSGNGTEGNGRTREGGEMPGTGGNVTPPAGRWPANLILVHAEGCEPKGARRVKGDGAGTRCSYYPGMCQGHNNNVLRPTFHGYPKTDDTASNEGREPVIDWRCVDGCPVRLLDAQSGESGGQFNAPSVRRREGFMHGSNGISTGSSNAPDNYGDEGTASRFFAQFHPYYYVPKASRSERDAGCESLPIQSGADLTDRQEGSDGLKSPRAGAGRTSGGRNTHATVKPVEMIRYLVRLVTPPGGTCLDPFMGSGTTGVACVREERDFVGIELLPEHMAFAEARIKHATAPEPWELPLFADLAPEPEQIPLFASLGGTP